MELKAALWDLFFMMINGRQLLPTPRFIFLPPFTHSPCRVLFVPVRGNQASQGWLTQCQVFSGCLCCLWVWSRPSLSPCIRWTRALLCTTWGLQVSHLICGKLSFLIKKMGVNIKQGMTVEVPNTFSALKWGYLNVNVSLPLLLLLLLLWGVLLLPFNVLAGGTEDRPEESHCSSLILMKMTRMMMGRRMNIYWVRVPTTLCGLFLPTLQQPFLWVRKYDQRGSNLLKVTQLVNGRGGISKPIPFDARVYALPGTSTAGHSRVPSHECEDLSIPFLSLLPCLQLPAFFWQVERSPGHARMASPSPSVS